jgi:hypothetical protein
MKARSTERGQILPFVGVCLVVLMGFAGLAVDLGYVQYQQRQLQSAADAAAVAGVFALINNDQCADQSAAQTAAYNDSSANGFTNGSNGVVITVSNPPASGPYTTDNCAVQVNVAAPLYSHFATLFNFSGNVASQATATVISNPLNACITFLNGGLSAAAPDIDAPKCAVLVNGGVSIAGGTIDTTEFGYTGSYSGAGVSYPEAQPTQISSVPNPCMSIAGCAYLTNHPPSESPCPSESQASGSLTLTPGCYNGLSLAGVALTLDPGLYEFTAGVSDAGGTITGNGVTIYQESGGFSSAGTSDSLSACTSSCTNGAESGILYYQPSSNSSGSAFAGTGATYNGLVYAPTASVSMAGSGNDTVIYVVGSGSLAGTTFVDTPPTPAPNAGPTPGGPFITTPVLAY